MHPCFLSPSTGRFCTISSIFFPLTSVLSLKKGQRWRDGSTVQHSPNHKRNFHSCTSNTFSCLRSKWVVQSPSVWGAALPMNYPILLPKLSPNYKFPHRGINKMFFFFLLHPPTGGTTENSGMAFANPLGPSTVLSIQKMSLTKVSKWVFLTIMCKKKKCLHTKCTPCKPGRIGQGQRVSCGFVFLEGVGGSAAPLFQTSVRALHGGEVCQRTGLSP